ncbi:hypothetical protein EGA29_20020 [Ralstonia pseudosolanacearum]|jgi:hypothetical protein|uniref:Uncharacterized protein n=1 Tax=Ralstonia pseudosolanacearum TaxID=1310165 RepID=A0A454TLR5_9RALS|nr:hypothetical protein EGA29_20020 [Ralstonia pseudosolanacearum]
MTAEQLARWIDKHHPAEPTLVNEDGTLTVSVECFHSPTGKRSVERSVIPATLIAARDWLGY